MLPSSSVIEDAIRVTLGLGYKYLWVDRYCIAQEGNETVKQEQVQNMHLVYANAEVTLVATAGLDASFGLPGTTDQRPRPTQLSARVKGHALACIPPDPSIRIRSSAWMKRGWTFQEGMFSRRRLFFSEREMSYECSNLLCREVIRLPPGINQRKLDLMQSSWIYERSGVMSSTPSGSDILRWVEEFTKQQLTYQSDILNAMLGFFGVFSQHEMNPMHHVCGVPTMCTTTPPSDGTDLTASLALGGFVSGLCWGLSRPAGRQPQFPSRSWTGWQGARARTG
jgi:hypothetical protein